MDEQLKNILIRGQFIVAILIIGVLIFFVGQLMLQSRSLDIQNQNQITVSGEGKVYAKPDVAIVSLGVTTQGKTVADATTSNTTKMNAVIAAVKAEGVADKDIQTTNYNLTPNYQTQPIIYSLPMIPVSSPVPVGGSSSNTITGYTLEQDVQVKIRDFTKIGDILDKATSAGSNQIGDLQFTIDNPQKFQDQARAQAIAQAKTNAQNLAKESGVNLGKIINVYENNYSTVPMAYNSVAKGGGVTESAPAPTIQPGQQEIDVTINLTYQVK